MWWDEYYSIAESVPPPMAEPFGLCLEIANFVDECSGGAFRLEHYKTPIPPSSLLADQLKETNKLGGCHGINLTDRVVLIRDVTRNVVAGFRGYPDDGSSGSLCTHPEYRGSNLAYICFAFSIVDLIQSNQYHITVVSAHGATSSMCYSMGMTESFDFYPSVVFQGNYADPDTRQRLFRNIQSKISMPVFCKLAGHASKGGCTKPRIRRQTRRKRKKSSYSRSHSKKRKN